jgi:hypothetical protein
MDRLFLRIFTVSVLVGTAGIILQAPTLYDDREPIISYQILVLMQVHQELFMEEKTGLLIDLENHYLQGVYVKIDHVSFCTEFSITKKSTQKPFLPFI